MAERKEQWPGLSDSSEVVGFGVNVYADSAILDCPVEPYSCDCGGAVSTPILTVDDLRELRDELSWAIERLETRDGAVKPDNEELIASARILRLLADPYSPGGDAHHLCVVLDLEDEPLVAPILRMLVKDGTLAEIGGRFYATPYELPTP